MSLLRSNVEILLFSKRINAGSVIDPGPISTRSCLPNVSTPAISVIELPKDVPSITLEPLIYNAAPAIVLMLMD